MRELYLDNGNEQFKFADTTTEIRLNAFDDGRPASLTADARVRIKNDSGYLLEVSANVKKNQAVITSGQLAKLPVGSYLLELWDTVEGGTAIYPSDGFLRLQINDNTTGISGGIISSITVDDFAKQISDLSQKLKKEVSEAVVTGLMGDNKGAGVHNATYRGANLGGTLSDAQAAAIKAGTFDGMYVGDYWVINNIVWRIVAFDYYYGTGDTACTTHHVTVMPDGQLYTFAMNDTNTTVGGYVGSKMYTEGLEQAKTTIIAAFGKDHILTHRLYLVNACVDGVPTGNAWLDSQVELPTEFNMYGSRVMSASPVGGKINPWDANGNHAYEVDKSQYPAFAANPSLISKTGQWNWLRSIVSVSNFANVDGDGIAGCDYASSVYGVRPAFSIC